MKPTLKRSDLEDLHSVLRRAAERAERNNDERLAARLFNDVAALAEEIAAFPSVYPPRSRHTQ